MDHAKRIIDTFSDNRFPCETVASNLIKQPLDTQEMYIYLFIRYIYLINSYDKYGMLPDEMVNIKNWSKELGRFFDKTLTSIH